MFILNQQRAIHELHMSFVRMPKLDSFKIWNAKATKSVSE